MINIFAGVLCSVVGGMNFGLWMKSLEAGLFMGTVLWMFAWLIMAILERK